jgi:hypothetical protein
MIEVGEAIVGSFDDLVMPETLYKYRDWQDKNHRRVISHQEVFFASPNSFEDKLDCKNPTRWDLLTYGEILDKYFQESPRCRKPPGWCPRLGGPLAGSQSAEGLFNSASISSLINTHCFPNRHSGSRSSSASAKSIKFLLISISSCVHSNRRRCSAIIPATV